MPAHLNHSAVPSHLHKVKDQKAKVDTTLYAYLKEEQRSPWWSAIFSAPFKVLGWTLSLFKDEPEEGDAKLDPFRLTKDESAIALLPP